jgi:hypothetical protein
MALGLSVVGTASAANCSDPPVSGNKYYIVNKDSGLQLDVGQASMADGATVLQWWGGGQANQQWTLTELSKGIWTMVASHSSSALDLYGWDSSEDAPVKQWTYSGNSNQQWLISGGSGGYTIASNLSKKLLTVADKSSGTIMKQHSQGSGLQSWYFNRVDGVCSNGTSTPTGSFGSFLGHTKILLGGQLDDATRKAAPFDVTYEYIHSLSAPYDACYDKCTNGCSTSARPWWGCWGAGSWDWTSGQEITNKNKYAKANWPNSAGTALIWEFTWYSGAQLGEAQGALEKQYSGTDGHADPKGGINNGPLLKGYMDDYRFFLKKIGTSQNIIHLEPDFWGFIRVQSGDHPNDPHYVPAQVQAANSTDCGSEENSAAGLASCLIKMARTYAPNSVVGLHLTCWDWYEDDTATRGPKACTKYYQGLGAGKGDFVATDVTDRDSAWAVRNVAGGQSYVWDDAKWGKYVAMLKMVTEAIGKPVELWQVPLGNANMTNWDNHWQDNKVWYIFNRMNDLANAHVVSIQFGAGESHQTYLGSDGGYMLDYAKSYYAQGGVSMK